MTPSTRLLAIFLAMGAGAASAATPVIPATPYAWHNVVIGGGGFSPGILFSPAEKGLAYLRTDVGGAYRWDTRQGSWIPLEDMIWQNSYLGVESIAPDPKDANVVYLAAGMYYGSPAAIMRSGDRGTSWTITEVPFSMGGNEDGRGMGERLAIDPNRTSTLFFGSRHDGVWRSDDSGAHWGKVQSFPWKGLGPPLPHRADGGVSFVVFDRSSGDERTGSKVIYTGVADQGPQHLFRSTDGGKTWGAMPGQPDPRLLPVKAAIDPNGIFYVDYCSGIGPNGIADGAVWKLDTRSGRWTDISPVRGDDAEGGYMGLSLDPQRPERLAVSTVDRWNHRDTVWLSNDAGAHWTSLRERSMRDLSTIPYLRAGDPAAAFGHWISGLAFDPFDGRTLAYATGLTVYRTADALSSRLLWRPWVKGVEETVPLSLISPTAGAHLVSGIGDVHGFVHDRLDMSPPRYHVDPDLPNTNNVDFAGLSPSVMVRSASGYEPSADRASLGWSDDGGHGWHPLRAPAVPLGSPSAARFDTNGEAPITVSTDGKTFVVSGPSMLATADRGRSWWTPRGLPADARAISDKVDAAVWYAADYPGSRIFVSRDGARSFQQAAARGLPADIAAARPRSRETPSPLIARIGTAGEIWLLAGGRLYRSTDFGQSFVAATSPELSFVTFGLGKAAPGASAPALYAFGITPHFGGLWRSIDAGASWQRINDDAHQWGLRYRVITGDPRIFGRVYVGTDGRGIFYGDPAPATPLR